MLEAEPSAGVAESEGSIAGPVVGHDAIDRNAEFGIVGDSGVQEGHGAALALIGHNPGKGDPRCVVDADVDELPADAAMAALTGPIAGDAMADLVETPELLDVDMDELAGPVALVSPDRLGRLQGLQPVEAQAAKHPGHGRFRHAAFRRDLRTSPAFAAQRLDPNHDDRGRWATHAMRP